MSGHADRAEAVDKGVYHDIPEILGRWTTTDPERASKRFGADRRGIRKCTIDQRLTPNLAHNLDVIIVLLKSSGHIGSHRNASLASSFSHDRYMIGT